MTTPSNVTARDMTEPKMSLQSIADPSNTITGSLGGRYHHPIVYRQDWSETKLQSSFSHLICGSAGRNEARGMEG
jgi:hypothetical protein